MDVITLVRAAVWLTFLLLIVGEVLAIILARRFLRLYTRKHRDLEVRVQAIERRLSVAE